MLGVHARLGVLGDDEVEALVEPAVVAVAVHEHEALLGEVLGLRIVQAHDEDSALDRLEARRVVAVTLEELLAQLRPLAAVARGERGEQRLGLRRDVGRVEDAFVRVQQLQRGELLHRVRREDGELVDAALVQHDDVARLVRVVLLQAVLLVARDARRREGVRVLRHAQRRDAGKDLRLHRLVVEARAEAHHVEREHRGARGLRVRRRVVGEGDAVPVGVDR
mmetsp:Transcript_11134/g.34586  ORF Transcript_11134/g.34586 Transcript_11134/m.34586 type:complete len:222 (-) Transcript_11134:87-752(-)